MDRLVGKAVEARDSSRACALLALGGGHLEEVGRLGQEALHHFERMSGRGPVGSWSHGILSVCLGYRRSEQCRQAQRRLLWSFSPGVEGWALSIEPVAPNPHESLILSSASGASYDMGKR